MILGPLGAVVLAGCQADGISDPRTEPPLVRVVVVGAARSVDTEFTGTVRAKVESDLAFRVSGKILSRAVEAGQTVKRGQPLIRLDPEDLRLAIAAQEQLIAAARAHLIETAADERRLRGLVGSGAVSHQAYDQAKAAADSAQAQLAAAEAQGRLAQNAGRYAVITADEEGVIVATPAEPGQVVAAGQTVIRLAHAGPREAAVYLPETIRPALGSTASARLYTKASEFPARLRLLSDNADPLTRTYEARYVLSGDGAAAPLGATVTLALRDVSTDASEGAVSVPLGSLHDAEGRQGVWKVDRRDSRVVFQSVHVGRIGEESAVVLSGLNPGDAIVALGAHLLHPGERVRVAASQDGGS
jgi:RND family efflux transporter MFP subunit